MQQGREIKKSLANLKQEQDVSPITVLEKLDSSYQIGCEVELVPDAVRVEQGEYAVLSRTEKFPRPIGTHHVTPCIIICARDAQYYGMAHFDSYRLPASLELFFGQFSGDGSTEIGIYGGKEGSDPLRTGSENKQAVLEYIRLRMPTAKVNVYEPVGAAPLNMVFHADGIPREHQFSAGVNANSMVGARLRLIHNIGGLITAQQSRTQEYIPLNLIEAYDGRNNSFLVDRLAVQAMRQFDPTPIPGESDAPNFDPGGRLLTEEVRVSYRFIMEEMRDQQAKLDENLSLIISDANLRDKLVTISPIYLGENSDALNIGVVKRLKKLYEQDPTTTYSEALALFNRESQYPLMQDMIPLIAARCNIDETLLREELQKKFPENLGVLAYGVDVVSSDIVEILQADRIAKNPALALTQILKGEKVNNQMVDAGGIVKGLCDAYHMDFSNTMKMICDEYNQQLGKPENVSRIVQAVGSTERIVKGNILQVVMEHTSTAAHVRIAKRIIDEEWNETGDPMVLLSSVFRKILPGIDKSIFEREYVDIAKVPLSAHLLPSSVGNLINMGFNDKMPGVSGVTGGILKDAIIAKVGTITEFKRDFNEKTVNSIELTKHLRDAFPYKNVQVERDLGYSEPENQIQQGFS